MAKRNAKARQWGRRPAVDERDFGLRRLRTVRRSKLWREYWAGDQGYTPHCVGFCAAHLLSTAPVKQWADPDGLYALAQRCDEWPGEDYDGTSVRAAFKVLHWLGFVPAYGFADSVAKVRAYVLGNGPVALGVDWLEGMENPGEDGLIRATGDSLGGHAILCTGYRRGRFRLLQSWEPTWGDHGHGWLPEADLGILLDRGGEAVTAVERRLAVPK